ncbi:hypothetical protein PW52_08595 [Tamlana sedimentorum]|uniref:DUF2971 domain-containing protein n=1 Tax=Neotamlana sedimentorum TaxID=1435349 RepID=A0A0D7WAU2_9FLAO|nr:DUF2971 domain-containing protein [Tamlana sedimentorum]KJD35783.1 hypothetical protein PW52_08595 [Tamlana sedimentorum]
MGLNFFKEIYNDDIIYHYTKSSIAIDYILYNEELKFGKRQYSIDPIESLKANGSVSFTGNYVDKEIDAKFSQELDKLAKRVFEMESAFSQICFCKNNIGHDFANKNYITQFEGHEELFGFTKPRMWERYADNYTGVCIAFSKKKILELNKKKYKLISKNVEYLKYRELNCRKVNNVSGNYLFKVGFEKYLEEIEKIAESSFFCKHTDYIGENEFRIGVYFDKNKCNVEEIKGELIFDKTMMLDIKSCIQAIFISSFSNEKQKRSFLEYAEKLNVPIIEMSWKHNSFEPIDYKETVKLFEKFDDLNK